MQQGSNKLIDIRIYIQGNWLEIVVNKAFIQKSKTTKFEILLCCTLACTVFAQHLVFSDLQYRYTHTKS